MTIEERENYWHSELNRARDKSALNPLLEPASDRAYCEAINFLLWTTLRLNLGNPFIAVPGDGGIIIEWNKGDDYISVNLDEKDKEMDVIFYRLGNERNFKDFNEKNFKELIPTFISKDETKNI